MCIRDRIKLVKDIEISGEWTPIKFPVREFDGNGHTITFDLSLIHI